jgi:hypothetical protein
MHTVDGVGETSLQCYDLGENGYPDADVIKELFPEWDGNEDTLEDFDGKAKCVEINMGTMLYAS